MEGGKYVCLDWFYQDGYLKNDRRCLAYSFGYETDWSFEKQLSKMGCHVRLFNPALAAASLKSPFKDDNITLHDYSLYHFTGTKKLKSGAMSVKTLKVVP